ncbi:MAG: hypothetical protein HYX54_05760 [Chloroflexi bacterium]|nr:hypothetical protein [Chloroflexota bacterium]
MTMDGADRRVDEVAAERDDNRWLLRVAGLPGVFSQVRRLDQAEGMARDAIAAFLDICPDGFDAAVSVSLPPNST